VERVKEGSFQLWTRADNEGTAHATNHRTWFHFEVVGAKEGETLSFSVMNLNRQSKLFSNDFRPVFRAHPSMKAGHKSSFSSTKTAAAVPETAQVNRLLMIPVLEHAH
jgi:hypothetical protein